MLEYAIQKYGISREESVLIGDKVTDIEAGRKSKVPSFLFAGGDLFSFVRNILG